MALRSAEEVSALPASPSSTFGDCKLFAFLRQRLLPGRKQRLMRVVTILSKTGTKLSSHHSGERRANHTQTKNIEHLLYSSSLNLASLKLDSFTIIGYNSGACPGHDLPHHRRSKECSQLQNPVGFAPSKSETPTGESSTRTRT